MSEEQQIEQPVKLGRNARKRAKWREKRDLERAQNPVPVQVQEEGPKKPPGRVSQQRQRNRIRRRLEQGAREHGYNLNG